MDNANKAIHCTVDTCAYHCDTQDYCSLDSITVGSHKKTPKKEASTDCQSFDVK